MARASLAAKIGDTVRSEDIVEYLEQNGYVRTSVVHERGEYAQRGGIFDIFAPGFEEPLRLDFFGDQLDALRQFDPETQRSTKQLTQAAFAPVSEILLGTDVISDLRARYIEEFGPPGGDPMFEAARSGVRRQGLENWLPLFHSHLETVFDYVPTGTILAFRSNVRAASTERFKQATDYFQARVEAAGSKTSARVLEPSRLYLDENELRNRGKDFLTLDLSENDAPEGSGQLELPARAARSFAPERGSGENVFEAVSAHAKQLRQDGKQVIFLAWTAGSVERLTSVLKDHDLSGIAVIHSVDASSKAPLAITECPLEQGFHYEDMVFFSEEDILGDRLARPRSKRKAANFIAEAASLSAGDFVVHIEHGVARYEGLQTVDVAGAPHDCLDLQYAGGDKLLLPVENIELVSRYGSDATETSLDRLGGAGWQTRKAKAKKKIMDMADELIRIAASRSLKQADALEGRDGYYEEFAARFPYEETDDQLRAIEETLEDYGVRQTHGSSGLRRCRVRKDRSCPACRLRCSDVRFSSCRHRANNPVGAAALRDIS